MRELSFTEGKEAKDEYKTGKCMGGWEGQGKKVKVKRVERVY